MVRLREELRAARRKLEAGERRERSLRRALRDTGLAPLPSRSRGERHTRAPPMNLLSGRGGAADSIPPPDGMASRLPIGTGGLLDKVLLESGMLSTEEGRREVAELLARASANSGAAQASAMRAPLPPPPSMTRTAATSAGQLADTSTYSLVDEPAAFSLPFEHGSAPARDISDRTAEPHLARLAPSDPATSGNPVPGFSNMGQPPAAAPQRGQHAPPDKQQQQQLQHMQQMQMHPDEAGGFGFGGAGSGGGVPFRYTPADAETTLDAIVAAVVGEEVPALVKQSVREAIAPMLGSTKRRQNDATGSALDGGVYGQIVQVLMTSVVSSEAEIVVGEAIRGVAEGFVQRRGAERVFESMVEEILTDELTPIAAAARVEVVSDELLGAAMEPICREVAVSVLHEARGAAARSREAVERRMVAEVASEGLFERLCLQRLLQHVATSGEVLLLQRQAAQMLDELVAEGLARRALSVGQEHSQLHSSAVFSAAHQRIAYSALVDEMLAQLRVLAASGLEAGVPPVAPETDTDGEEEDDEDDELAGAAGGEPAAVS